MGTEQWIAIPDTVGRYEVSDCGRVRSYCYSKGVHDIPLIKRPFVSNVGYLTVALSLEGRQRNYGVHRLVMLAFVGPSLLTVNHKDGNKQNNQLSNLEYMTRSENIKHSYDTLGRKTPKGEASANARLSDAQVTWLRKLAAEGKSNKELVEIFDISFNHVSRLKMAHTRSTILHDSMIHTLNRLNMAFYRVLT